jgi:hypothetical protein
MDEAATQAAGGGTRTADEPALAALRYGWGDAYMIGWDGERGWWAARRDLIGGYLTAHDADELWTAIQQDYDLKPVPRDLPPEALP